MHFPSQSEAACLLTHWVVPLFIVFNVIGWWGLPQREAARVERAAWPPRNRPDKKLTYDDLALLGRAIWAAWLVGILGALIVLAAVSRFCGALLDKEGVALPYVVGFGILGVVLGLARVLLPSLRRFRRQSTAVQRRILAALVMCAVSLSMTSGVLYYNSQDFLHDVIPAGFACMLFGYTVSLVFQL